MEKTTDAATKVTEIKQHIEIKNLPGTFMRILFQEG